MREYTAKCKFCYKKFPVQDWKDGEELDTCFTCLVSQKAVSEILAQIKTKKAERYIESD
jgi:hypothetical protein